MNVHSVLLFLSLSLSALPIRALDLRGRVVDLDGAPLAEAFIELRGPDAAWETWTWTSAAGTWHMSNLQIEDVEREAPIGGAGPAENLHLESGRLGLRFGERNVSGRWGSVNSNSATASGRASGLAARGKGGVPDTLVVTWRYAWVERRVLVSPNQGDVGSVRIDTSSRRDSLDLATDWYLPTQSGRYAYTLFDSSSLEQPSLTTTQTEAELVRGGGHDSCRGTQKRISVNRQSLQDSVASDSSWAVESLAWTANLANRFQGPSFGRDTVVQLGGAMHHVHLVGGGYSSTMARGREALLVVPGWGVVFARARMSVMSGILARGRTLRLRSVDGVPLDQAELERLWSALQ